MASGIRPKWGAVELAAFLTSLTVEGNVAASTQKNEDFGGRDICYLI